MSRALNYRRIFEVLSISKEFSTSFAAAVLTGKTSDLAL